MRGGVSGDALLGHERWLLATFERHIEYDAAPSPTGF